MRSIATAKDFNYEDALRRADLHRRRAHERPAGRHDARRKIELYLKPSGDELERAEAYENVDAARAEPQDHRRAADLLRPPTRRYVVTGAPVTIVDECARDDRQDVDLLQGTDRIVVDGNEQIRTQTKRQAATAAESPPHR